MTYFIPACLRRVGGHIHSTPLFQLPTGQAKVKEEIFFSFFPPRFHVFIVATLQKPFQPFTQSTSSDCSVPPLVSHISEAVLLTVQKEVPSLAVLGLMPQRP